MTFCASFSVKWKLGNPSARARASHAGRSFCETLGSQLNACSSGWRVRAARTKDRNSSRLISARVA